MERTIAVIYQDGVLKPLEPLTLEDGEEIIMRYDEKASPSKQRILGLHPGSIWTSEDFDEPLPDAFWAGEE